MSRARSQQLSRKFPTSTWQGNRFFTRDADTPVTFKQDFFNRNDKYNAKP
jgi:hypothetical protein